MEEWNSGLLVRTQYSNFNTPTLHFLDRRMALTTATVSIRIGADFELSLQDQPSNREDSGYMLEAETVREQCRAQPTASAGATNHSGDSRRGGRKSAARR
jgi:hypothetical protein